MEISMYTLLKIKETKKDGGRGIWGWKKKYIEILFAYIDKQLEIK